MASKSWIPFVALLLIAGTAAATMAPAPPSPDGAGLEVPAVDAVGDVYATGAAAAAPVTNQIAALRENGEYVGSQDDGPFEMDGATLPVDADETIDELEALGATGLELTDELVLRPAQAKVATLQREVTQMAEEDEPVSEQAAPASTSAAVKMDYTVPLILTGAAVAAAGGAVMLWMAGSSGSVGSMAATRTSDIRRVLPIASPLFTRFEKDTVMGHPKREELYALIVSQPGIPLQQMCDATGLSRTAVTHHLRLLEHHHLVVSRRVGRSRHFYENGGRYGRDQKEAYAVLQNDRSREVADYIRSHPGAIQKQLCAALGLQASIAHWHVRRLQEASLIETTRQGRTVSYFPGANLQALEA